MKLPTFLNGRIPGLPGPFFNMKKNQQLDFHTSCFHIWIVTCMMAKDPSWQCCVIFLGMLSSRDPKSRVVGESWPISRLKFKFNRSVKSTERIAWQKFKVVYCKVLFWNFVNPWKPKTILKYIKMILPNLGWLKFLVKKKSLWWKPVSFKSFRTSRKITTNTPHSQISEIYPATRTIDPKFDISGTVRCDMTTFRPLSVTWVMECCLVQW